MNIRAWDAFYYQVLLTMINYLTRGSKVIQMERNSGNFMLFDRRVVATPNRNNPLGRLT
ncbi:hypothetical protein Plhal304r1_c018g0064751 [Plasmopara halstedii]